MILGIKNIKKHRRKYRNLHGVIFATHKYVYPAKSWYEYLAYRKLRAGIRKEKRKMKRYQRNKWIALFTGIMLCISCVFGITDGKISTNDMNPIIPYSNDTPSLTPKSTQATTNIKTENMKPSVTVTNTSQLIPTISDAEKTQQWPAVNQFLNCTNPCWWGIKLGDTTWEEVQTFLAYMSLESRIEHSDFTGKEITRHRIEENELGDKLITTDIDIYEEESVITYLRIHSKADINEKSAFEEIRNKWNYYSPEKIIENYGLPTRIFLRYEEGIKGGPRAYYQLWLYYDENGFIVGYFGLREYEENMKFCMRMSEKSNYPTDIFILIKDLSDETPLENLPIYTFKKTLPDTIQEVLGIEIPEFIEMMNDPKISGCIIL